MSNTNKSEIIANNPNNLASSIEIIKAKPQKVKFNSK